MKKNLLSLAIHGAVVCLSSAAFAQSVSEAEFIATLEEIVVTGTANGGEMRKLDASFAITNVSGEDITKFSPKSTADLLKSIPGVWAESSGGVAGANVFVRGFPSGGDAPFYTLELEGAPIFPPATLSFLENTSLFRVDETIERVEGLRGGPQSVQDNGQPGLTTNFLLKKGSEETEGLLKYSTSDYDLQRFDGMVSGELGDGFYYMMGGYISTSTGIRDAGYSSEEGNQFTININKDFDQGSLSFYHRATDDHGTWYLPSALNVDSIDNAYTQHGTLNRQRVIQYGPNNEERSVDLADGRGWDGSVTGAVFELEISDNWSLSNSLNFTSGDADTLGFVPNGGAVNVAALLADASVDSGAVITGPLTGAVTGAAISGDAYIQQFGTWEVLKQIESFTNNMALEGSFDSFDIVLGYYAASTSTDEQWSLGNHEYFVVGSGGELVNGIACNEPGIDSCGWNYDIDAVGDAKDNAFYSVLTYRVSGDVSIDFGVRSENHEVQYTVDEGRDGIITKSVDYDESETSYTAGANWAIGENQGVFARVSQGFKFPYFDDFRDNYGAFEGGDDLVKEVTQFELGYKASYDNLSAYLTFFGNEVKGDSFVARPGAPAENFTNEAYGVEIDVRWMHESGLSMVVNGTIQETEITESPTDNGNESQRQPGFQLRLAPSYDFQLANNMEGTVYGSVSIVDDRYANNANSVVLPSYEKFDLGVILNASENVALQLVLDNLTDEEGLTEGDPRNAAAPNGRYILPKNVKLSVAYAF